MEKLFCKRLITQIGILTDDIQKTKAIWERFLSLPSQTVSQSDGYDKTNAFYRGKPLEGRISQVCFRFDNVELELIEPIGNAPSYWKECLESKGPGIHHISFAVKNMEECTKELEDLNIPALQYGDFPGGRYAYLDASDSMNVILELLEKDQEVLLP